MKLYKVCSVFCAVAMPMDECVFQKTCVFAMDTPLKAPSVEIIESIAFAVASCEAIH